MRASCCVGARSAQCLQRVFAVSLADFETLNLWYGRKWTCMPRWARPTRGLFKARVLNLNHHHPCPLHLHRDLAPPQEPAALHPASVAPTPGPASRARTPRGSPPLYRPVQPCQPRAQASTHSSQPTSARRTVIAHTRAIPASLLIVFHEQARSIRRHESRLPAPRHGGPPGWADPAPQRAARQHPHRVRDGVAAQCRLRGTE
jgi:hypothetical protein